MHFSLFLPLSTAKNLRERFIYIYICVCVCVCMYKASTDLDKLRREGRLIRDLST